MNISRYMSAPILEEKYSDGSVSCIVGAIDLPSGTKWNVEIKLSPRKAFFETKARWFNTSELPCTYYHWMNAAAKAGDDLEFIYPGKNWIGHGGETGNWPRDNNRDIHWYKNNNFGSYKSYHIINSYSDFFGGYWHNEDFGFGHYSDFDEMPGKKLWIWGLAPEGMIWEDLLTDTDGQYIEYQAGKLFNQAANSSTNSPFKHKEFVPHDADIMRELWFPLKGTGGMKAVSEFGVLNVLSDNNNQKILFSALQDINEKIYIYKNGELYTSETVNLKPLELFEKSVKANSNDNLQIVLGDKKLIYNTDKNNILVNRPLSLNKKFNWNSAYGHYTKGLELEKQRVYKDAMDEYKKALEEDGGFLPALTRLSLAYYRRMDYDNAYTYANKALSVDTYDGEANYLLGLISRELGDISLSKSSFSIAMQRVGYRSSAATELAILFLKEKNWDKAQRYSEKALAFNIYNLDALQVLALSHRKAGEKNAARNILQRIGKIDGLNHFQKFETYLLSDNSIYKDDFVSGISNELVHETYLDLAISYYNTGCIDEAIEVLKLSPQNSIVDLWLAFLKSDERQFYLNRALKQPAKFIFPHRVETAKILSTLIKENSNWKLKYFSGLIFWHKGLVKEAEKQFAACGDNPDFAAFYLAKKDLVSSREEQVKCIKRAFRLEPKSWRAAIAMSNYYLEEDKALFAKELISPFLKLHPEQPAIGLCYARCLSKNKDYKDAIRFLENYKLLPFEGATVSRDLYNEVCIRSALRALKENRYSEAIKFAKKAKLWPDNLGVGRPYDVDERLEDYILYSAYLAKGSNKLSDKFAKKIMFYKHPGFKEESSRLYIQLKVLRENGRTDVANKLIDLLLKQYPENRYIKWAVSKFNNSFDTDKIKTLILEDSFTPMAYDTKFIDKGFMLMLDFVSSIEKE